MPIRGFDATSPCTRADRPGAMPSAGSQAVLPTVRLRPPQLSVLQPPLTDVVDCFPHGITSPQAEQGAHPVRTSADDGRVRRWTLPVQQRAVACSIKAAAPPVFQARDLLARPRASLGAGGETGMLRAEVHHVRLERERTT